MPLFLLRYYVITAVLDYFTFSVLVTVLRYYGCTQLLYIFVLVTLLRYYGCACYFLAISSFLLCCYGCERLIYTFRCSCYVITLVRLHLAI